MSDAARFTRDERVELMLAFENHLEYLKSRVTDQHQASQSADPQMREEADATIHWYTDRIATTNNTWNKLLPLLYPNGR